MKRNYVNFYAVKDAMHGQRKASGKSRRAYHNMNNLERAYKTVACLDTLAKTVN